MKPKVIALSLLLNVLVPALATATDLVDAADQELVGDWELISIIENGIDVTGDLGLCGDGASVYSFHAEGTFSITSGGNWFESGTWTAQTDTTPKRFDHTPVEAPGDPEIVGIASLGIYKLSDGIASLCIADNPPDRRPTDFDTNTCLLFILRKRTSAADSCSN